jgi:hypothetical protein
MGPRRDFVSRKTETEGFGNGLLTGFSWPKVNDPQRLKTRRMNANLLFM